MNKKPINQIIITSIALILVTILVSGGTFAYLSWTSADNTLINITFSEENDGIKMLISPVNMVKTGMYPTTGKISNGTQDLDSHPAVMVGQAYISVINNTGVVARPRFMLKIKIMSTSSNNFFTAQYMHAFKYAVTEANGDCDNPIASGSFRDAHATGGSAAQGWFNSPTLTVNNANGFPAITSENASSVSFNAPAYTTTPHTYKVCVWVDSGYTHTNTGNTVSDGLQNARVLVSWSEDSSIEQVRT